MKLLSPVRPTPSRALALLLACAGLAGCGGGGGGSATSTAGTEASSGSNSRQASVPQEAGSDKRQSGGASAKQEAGTPAGAFHPKPHHDSGGGSGQFVVKGGDNSIQQFGDEASEDELHEAAAALHGFLDARAERNWAAACSYLSAGVTKSLEELASRSPKLKGSACPTILASFSAGVPDSALREAAQANVGSLRREGSRAFVIYRGAPNDSVYAITMTREGDAWKMGSLSGVPLG